MYEPGGEQQARVSVDARLLSTGYALLTLQRKNASVLSAILSGFGRNRITVFTFNVPDDCEMSARRSSVATEFRAPD
jgi:hypothetical protein